MNFNIDYISLEINNYQIVIEVKTLIDSVKEQENIDKLWFLLELLEQHLKFTKFRSNLINLQMHACILYT